MCFVPCLILHLAMSCKIQRLNNETQEKKQKKRNGYNITYIITSKRKQIKYSVIVHKLIGIVAETKQRNKMGPGNCFIEK